MQYYNSGKRKNREKGKFLGRIFIALISFSFLFGVGFGIYTFLSPMEVSLKGSDLTSSEAVNHDNLRTSTDSITVSQLDSGSIEPQTGTATAEKKIGAIDPNNVYWIKIEKSTFQLFLMMGNKVIKKYKVALGKNDGDKKRAGDMRTPEGIFYVERIQDSNTWEHDFKDGRGLIAGAYGPKFIRLKTGWSGIGIHGTHDPSSIGKKVTEGCVRLNNEDLVELVRFVKPGLKVQINP